MVDEVRERKESSVRERRGSKVPGPSWYWRSENGVPSIRILFLRLTGSSIQSKRRDQGVVDIGFSSF